jgi:ankyrin repeat protein
MEKVAKELKDTDCAIISYKTTPSRYIIAKNYKNTGWVVRYNKNSNGEFNYWLTSKQVLNGKCKKVKVLNKLSIRKAVELLIKTDLKIHEENWVVLGNQWKKNDRLDEKIKNVILIEAVIDRDIHKVQEYIQLGIDVNVQDYQGNTPVHFASSLGHKKILKYLIRSKANVNVKNKFNEIPLHMAINLKTVKLLLDNGSFKDIKDKSGETPLFYNVKSESFDVIKEIVKRGGNVNIVNNDKVGLLHYASSLGNLNLVKFLIESKVNTKSKDSQGDTSLHYACAYGYPEVVKELIKVGISVNSVNNKKRTPLDLAIKSGSLNSVKILIDNGAKIKKSNLLFEPIKVISIDNKDVFIDDRTDIINYFKKKGFIVKMKSEKYKEIFSKCKDAKNSNNPLYVCNPLSKNWILKTGSTGKVIEYIISELNRVG